MYTQKDECIYCKYYIINHQGTLVEGSDEVKWLILINTTCESFQLSVEEKKN